jgi:hypothetical protein
VAGRAGVPAAHACAVGWKRSRHAEEHVSQVEAENVQT